MLSSYPSEAPIFAFFRLRFQFLACDPIYFPASRPGNIIRGAFGTILRKISCAADCPGTNTCPRRAGCAYTRIFEPGSAKDGPSGLSDWPRPFVFRALHLTGKTILPGSTFHFDVHLFDLREPSTAYFVLTFAELAKSGLGPRRGRATLLSVDQIDLFGEPIGRLYQEAAMVPQASVYPSSISSAQPMHVNKLRISFLSPTELKYADSLAIRPDFSVVFARARDRVSTLNSLYGAEPWHIDYKALGQRAEQVRLTHCDVRNIKVERQSSRTGQRHPIGGFVGSAEYQGELTEFLPYLMAAEYTGIGRQTTFGNGQICVTPI